MAGPRQQLPVCMHVGAPHGATSTMTNRSLKALPTLVARCAKACKVCHQGPEVFAVTISNLAWQHMAGIRRECYTRMWLTLSFCTLMPLYTCSSFEEQLQSVHLISCAVVPSFLLSSSETGDGRKGGGPTSASPSKKPRTRSKSAAP